MKKVHRTRLEKMSSRLELNTFSRSAVTLWDMRIFLPCLYLNGKKCEKFMSGMLRKRSCELNYLNDASPLSKLIFNKERKKIIKKKKKNHKKTEKVNSLMIIRNTFLFLRNHHHTKNHSIFWRNLNGLQSLQIWWLFLPFSILKGGKHEISKDFSCLVFVWTIRIEVIRDCNSEREKKMSEKMRERGMSEGGGETKFLRGYKSEFRFQFTFFNLPTFLFVLTPHSWLPLIIFTPALMTPNDQECSFII